MTSGRYATIRTICGRAAWRMRQAASWLRASRHAIPLGVAEHEASSTPEGRQNESNLSQTVTPIRLETNTLPSDFALLTCGNLNGATSELAQILTHVQSSSDYVVDQLIWLGTEDPRRISVFGPFLGRSLLELAVTALIGRFDPLRLLVVREVQAQRDYDTEVAWKASIRWQGDVLAKKVPTLWGEAIEYEKITKALFGDYYDHLVWRPAARRVLETCPTGGAWFAELANIDAETFATRKREELGRLYSSLSKGIHHEFVMPPGALYDRDTVIELVQRTIHVVADISLVSHFVGHAAFCLSQNEALDAFNRLENFEVTT